MNWVTALVILVPSVLSFSVSLVYAYIALKKSEGAAEGCYMGNYHQDLVC